MRTETANVRPGMTVPSLGGRGVVAAVIPTTDRRGNDRLTLTFTNGLIAANLRPTDLVEATRSERSNP